MRNFAETMGNVSMNERNNLVETNNYSGHQMTICASVFHEMAFPDFWLPIENQVLDYYHILNSLVIMGHFKYLVSIPQIPKLSLNYQLPFTWIKNEQKGIVLDYLQ